MTDNFPIFHFEAKNLYKQTREESYSHSHALRETETAESMAASKLQALWSHPAGPKTSELTPPHLFATLTKPLIFYLFIYVVVKVCSYYLFL